MAQNNIRPYDGVTYTEQETSDFIDEVKNRTDSSQTGYDSIDELATKVKALNIANDEKLDKNLNQDETIDLEGNMLSIINGRSDRKFTEESISPIIRPVADSLSFTGIPSEPITVTTDYHGVDLKYNVLSDNANDKLSVYPFESTASSTSNNQVGGLIAGYFLSQCFGMGGAKRLTSLRLWARNRSSGVVDIAAGLLINSPISDGGGSITNAYGIEIKDVTVGTSENYGIKSEANNFFRKIEVSDTNVVANLNAEMVGGKIGDNLLSGSNATITKLSTNADNINETGFFTLKPTATNVPYSNYWTITSIQINNGLDYFSQYAVDLIKGDAYIRSKNNGVFTEWKKISVVISKATIDRPSTAITGESIFDTTLGKPIWFDGSNWVDSTGTTV